MEGWAEELLIPALAKLMKSSGIINRDLTEAGVSVVNVGGTAYLRYAKIFLRKAEPTIGIPVSIITDLDIPEYSKSGDDYIALDAADLMAEKEVAINQKKSDLDDDPVRVFVAPHWTLEYSLLSFHHLPTREIPASRLLASKMQKYHPTY